MTDNFYADKWDQQLEATPPSATRKNTYVNWLSPDGSDPSIDKTVEADALAEQARMIEAGAVVDSELHPERKLEKLRGIANRQGLPGTPGETAEGVYNTLLAQESSEERAKAIGNRDAYLSRIKENVDYARSAVEGLRPARSIEERIADPEAGERGFWAKGRKLRTTLEALEFLIPGKYTLATAKILDKYVPAQGLDSPEERRVALQNLIRTSSPEDAKRIVDDIINGFEDSVGLPGTENQLFKWTIMSEFLGSMEYLDAETQRKLILADPETTFGASMAVRLSDTFDTDTNTVLDLIPVVGAGKVLASRGAAALGDVRAAIDVLRNPLSIDFSLTEAGAEKAVKAATSTDPVGATAALGLDPATVVSRHAAPTMGEKGWIDQKGAVLEALRPSGKVEMSNFYITEQGLKNDRAAIEAAARATFGVRLNDTLIVPTDEGLEAVVRLGTQKGIGWKNQQAAEMWAKTKLGDNPWRAVQDETGMWQVEMRSFRPYTTEIDTIEDLGFVKNQLAIGRASVFNDWFNHAVGTAMRKGDMAASEARVALQPFLSLDAASSGRVQEALVWAEGQSQRIGIPELTARGMSGKEIDAFMGVRAVTDRLFAAKNANIYTLMKQEGWQEATINGALSFVKPINQAPSAVTKVVDMATGKVVRLSALPAGGKFVKIMDDVARGTTTGYIAPNASVTLKALGPQVLQPQANWLPRHYTASHMVKVWDAASETWKAHKTARSQFAGDSEVAMLATTDPKNRYKVFHVSEISDELQTIDDIAMAREMGLLRNSRRRQTMLDDVEGETMAVNVFDSINQLANSVSAQEGFRRLTIAVGPAFEQRFGKLGFTSDLGRIPPMPADKAQQKLWREAVRTQEYLRLLNGLDRATLGSQFRSFRNLVADFFYNTGSRARPYSRATGRVSEWIGDQVSGLNPQALRIAKTHAFFGYIAANVPTQWLLQTSSIPVFSSVKGGLKYMTGGRFQRDMMILEARGYPALAESIGEGFGMSKQEVKRLLADAAKSGIDEAVDGHLFTLGTVNSGRLGRESAAGKAFDGVLNATRRVGFDWATRREKRAAWLIVRNRAVLNKQDLNSPAVLRQINNEAEGLTLNLNRSDPLTSSQGLASLLLQFMGHPVKATQRLVGGTLGLTTRNKKWLETGFTAGEQTRYGLATLLFYGAAGLGANEVAERIFTDMEKQTGEPVSDEVRLAVREGLIGAAINAGLRAAFDEEGESTNLAYSERFSPLSHVGTYAQNTKALVSAVMTMDTDQLLTLSPSAASLGLVGDMAKWFDRSKFLALALPEDVMDSRTTALNITKDFFRQYPIVSNVLRAQAGLNMMAKVNSNGDPVVEATSAEAIAQVLGIRSMREFDYAKLAGEVYGTTGIPDAEGLGAELENEVAHVWTLLQPVLDKMADGSYNIEDGVNLITGMNVAYFTALDPHQYAAFRDGLVKRLLRGTPKFKDERLFDAIMTRLDHAPAHSSFADKVKGLNYKHKDLLLETLENSFKAVEE